MSRVKALVWLAATVLAVSGTSGWAAKGAKKGKPAQDVAVLAGEVHGSDEVPLPGAAVRLVDASDGVIFEGTAGDGGRFEIEVTSPQGSYRLRLAHADYAPFETELELAAGQRYDYVLKLIDRATADLQDARTAFNEGAAHYESGETAAAKERFEAARALDPTLPQPYLALADIYLGEGALEQARESIVRYREAMPDDLRAIRLAYQIHHAAGDRDGAATMLERLRGTEYALPLAQTIYNEGVAAMREGDDAGAIERFEASAGMGAKIAEPLVGLASVHYNAGQYEDVRRALERLAEVDPNNRSGLRLRYLLHDALAEGEAAAAAYEAYRAIDPKGAAGLLYERAELDFRDGDAAAARTALLRILADDPDHARAHYTLGLAYASLGDSGKAREHLQRFLDLAPDDPEAASAREMLPHLQ